jgi:hypothetical protein
MKDLAITVIAILAIVAVANTKQVDMQSGFGGAQVVNLAERGFIGDDLPTDAVVNLDDEQEISQYEETTAYTDDADLYDAIDEGSLRTAVLK